MKTTYLWQRRNHWYATHHEKSSNYQGPHDPSAGIDRLPLRGTGGIQTAPELGDGLGRSDELPHN